MPRRAATAAALLLAIAAAQGQSAHAAAPARTCVLSPTAQQPPGGTPAYALTVSQRNTSCTTATKVMQAFHRCRGEGRSRCAKPILAGRWRCTGESRHGPSLGLPVARHGSFTCRRGARHVQGTYQENGPPCLGAAARDPLRPCTNPATATTITPDLDELEPHALDLGSAGCDPTIVPGACVFGVPDDQATRHIAIVGDSHTVHWRAALALVAQVERWRGYSFTGTGCFFSTAAIAFRPDCAEYLAAITGWFKDHPEVDTVFVTSNADTPVAIPAGETNASFKIAGFQAAFKALPKTVEHVVVLRDTPASTQQTFECMSRAQTAGRRPGISCPLARETALREDLAVQAAQQLDAPRYASIDMTQYFCGRRDCYPVIGGVRVNADIFGHLTATYMRSLGPYLLRAVRRLQARR